MKLHDWTTGSRIVLSIAVGLVLAGVARAELVAHWKLNEGSGDVFADSAGDHDGFLVSGAVPEWSDDTPPTGFANPYSLHFDPASQTFVDTTFEGVGGDTPRTISAWIKTQSTASQGIVAYGARDANGRKWHFRINDGGDPRVPGAVRTEAQGGNQTGDTDLSDGQWHHVVSVFPSLIGDNSEVMHYVDGVLEGETGTTDEPIDTGIGDGFPRVSIGARRQTPPALDSFMDGWIDDVRIYDRELAADEIIDLATNPTTDGLVAYWPFDDGPDNTTASETVAGNNGTLTSTISSSITWTTDSPPVQDYAVEFSGNNSWIQTEFPGIGEANPRTVTFWVKTDVADDAPSHGIVGWGASNDTEKWHIRVNNNANNGKLGAIRTEVQGGQNVATTPINDDQWHHIAVVFPDNGAFNSDVMHYVDGELDPQSGGGDQDVNTAIVPDPGAEPVTIGMRIQGTTPNFFPGLVADVRIYDEALSEQEIQEIMAGGGLTTRLQPGDANMDLQFNQLDLVKVQIAAKYLTGQSATWGEGDWDGAPGGEPGNPPDGDGQFNQLDIIAALGAGVYLTGPYGALAADGNTNDGQTSIGYNVNTGEVFVDAPAGTDLTSINIDSEAGIFTGDPAQNLGGSFDNDADNNVFKATFGSSFGSITFGNVAQPGLDKEFVLADLTVVGSLAGGGDLGGVDLIYVPEPSSFLLLLLAAGLWAAVAAPSWLVSLMITRGAIFDRHVFSRVDVPREA